MSNSKKILFQLSGSIAAFKACEVISSLCKSGHEVRCITTPAALKFVGVATLEGLTGNKVLSDIFTPDHAMDHIELERWADLIILCPATASTLNKLACGIGDDLVSTTFLAHEFKKPYLIAPAMNHAMWSHPTTQASVKKLIHMGLQFIEPDDGPLACGESGQGRLASPQRIVAEVEKFLCAKPGPRVLVTFGGTEEKIDGVRTLSNFSSGKTGAVIADQLTLAGFQVTALAAEKSQKPLHRTELKTFRSFQDLDKMVHELLSQNEFATIIHLAAVSDFAVQTIEINGKRQSAVVEKLKSTDQISIHLKANFKIVERLKEYSKNKHLQVIAFKLTNTPDQEDRQNQIRNLAQSENIDYVVHNDIADISESEHFFKIYQKEKIIAQGNGKNHLASSLMRIVSGESL